VESVEKSFWSAGRARELDSTYLEDFRRFGKYPLSPTESFNLSSFELLDAQGKVGSWSRLRAYLVAPQTGAYSFYVNGQETVSLSVSLSGRTYERQLACTTTNIAPGTWTSPSGSYYLKAGGRYYLEFSD